MIAWIQIVTHYNEGTIRLYNNASSDTIHSPHPLGGRGKGVGALELAREVELDVGEVLLGHLEDVA